MVVSNTLLACIQATWPAFAGATADDFSTARSGDQVRPDGRKLTHNTCGVLGLYTERDGVYRFHAVTPASFGVLVMRTARWDDFRNRQSPVSFRNSGSDAAILSKDRQAFGRNRTSDGVVRVGDSMTIANKGNSPAVTFMALPTYVEPESGDEMVMVECAKLPDGSIRLPSDGWKHTGEKGSLPYATRQALVCPWYTYFVEWANKPASTGFMLTVTSMASVVLRTSFRDPNGGEFSDDQETRQDARRDRITNNSVGQLFASAVPAGTRATTTAKNGDILEHGDAHILGERVVGHKPGACALILALCQQTAHSCKIPAGSRAHYYNKVTSRQKQGNLLTFGTGEDRLTRDGLADVEYVVEILYPRSAETQLRLGHMTGRAIRHETVRDRFTGYEFFYKMSSGEQPRHRIYENPADTSVVGANTLPSWTVERVVQAGGAAAGGAAAGAARMRGFAAATLRHEQRLAAPRGFFSSDGEGMSTDTAEAFLALARNSDSTPPGSPNRGAAARHVSGAGRDPTTFAANVSSSEEESSSSEESPSPVRRQSPMRRPVPRSPMRRLVPPPLPSGATVPPRLPHPAASAPTTALPPADVSGSLVSLPSAEQIRRNHMEAIAAQELEQDARAARELQDTLDGRIPELLSSDEEEAAAKSEPEDMAGGAAAQPMDVDKPDAESEMEDVGPAGGAAAPATAAAAKSRSPSPSPSPSRSPSRSPPPPTSSSVSDSEDMDADSESEMDVEPAGGAAAEPMDVDEPDEPAPRPVPPVIPPIRRPIAAVPARDPRPTRKRKAPTMLGFEESDEEEAAPAPAHVEEAKRKRTRRPTRRLLEETETPKPMSKPAGLRKKTTGRGKGKGKSRR